METKVGTAKKEGENIQIRQNPLAIQVVVS